MIDASITQDIGRILERNYYLSKHKEIWKVFFLNPKQVFYSHVRMKIIQFCWNLKKHLHLIQFMILMDFSMMFSVNTLMKTLTIDLFIFWSLSQKHFFSWPLNWIVIYDSMLVIIDEMTWKSKINTFFCWLIGFLTASLMPKCL